MGATATLSATGLAVAPGEDVTCTVVVRNTGDLVDEFTVDVVGDAGAWATAEPASVNLVPQASASVVVRFAPPRAAEVVAGPVAFGVRVTSREDPYGSVVEEGVVDVGTFTDLSAELVPAKVEAGARGRFEVAVDNVGNHPVAVRLSPTDPDGELEFKLDRTDVVLAPGTAAFVKLVAKPRDTFLRGPSQPRPFRVEVVPSSGPPLSAAGTLVQRQLLPKWLLPALIALLALAALLVGLWFTVLRPAVKSAAREAAEQQVQEVKTAVDQAQLGAGEAREQAKDAEVKSEEAMKAAGLDPQAPPGSPPTAKPGQPTGEPGEPTDFRVAADAAVVANPDVFTDFTFTPPADKALLISDIVLQNPRGDAGTVRVLRDANGTRGVLLEVGLANFRDLDRHYVEPLRFKPGERIVVQVSCQNPDGKGNCRPAVSFAGRQL
jgi:type II secretory pathway pseudopilin PulG